MQSGAGLAAAALPGFGQATVLGIEGVLRKESNAATAEHCVQRPIVHPGVLQTREDLEFAKAKINAGEEPWKSSWQIWLDNPVASLDFTPKPCVHVVRGAYDIPDKGGHEIQDSANAAENHVMQWYVTGDKAHARKAIRSFRCMVRHAGGFLRE